MNAYETFLQSFGLKQEALLDNVVMHGKRFFYDPKNNKEWCDEHALTPHSFGLFLGEVKNTFRPSPLCIERMAKHSKEKAVIDKKAAWLFLCQRDVFGRALITGEPKPGKPVFVFDEEKNLLGYGEWVGDKPIKNKPVIKHKVDKGEYLRRK